MKRSLEVVQHVLGTLREHGIVLVNSSDASIDAIAATIGAQNKKDKAAIAFALKATFDPKTAERREFSLRCQQDLQAVLRKAPTK